MITQHLPRCASERALGDPRMGQKAAVSTFPLCPLSSHCASNSAVFCACEITASSETPWTRNKNWPSFWSTSWMAAPHCWAWTILAMYWPFHLSSKCLVIRLAKKRITSSPSKIFLVLDPETQRTFVHKQATFLYLCLYLQILTSLN